MAIRSILVAFDFSEPSQHALRWAHDLARRSNAQLAVVHVHPDVYAGGEAIQLGVPWPHPEQMEHYLRFLAQEVRAAARDLVGDAQPESEVRIEHGDPVRCLLEHAAALHADMVVVGATGKNGVQRMLLGSVSQSVLRKSAVPVAIVH